MQLTTLINKTLLRDQDLGIAYLLGTQRLLRGEFMTLQSLLRGEKAISLKANVTSKNDKVLEQEAISKVLNPYLAMNSLEQNTVTFEYRLL